MWRKATAGERSWPSRYRQADLVTWSDILVAEHEFHGWLVPSTLDLDAKVTEGERFLHRIPANRRPIGRLFQNSFRPCRLTGKQRLAYHAVMADLFEALAAPARRAILDVLRERDGQTLFEICARLSMTQNLALTRQAISQHLEVLESAGLLSTKREGRYKYHYLITAPLETIVQRWLTPLSSNQKRIGK